MRKFIFVFLVICGLWDLQKIPGHAAEIANFHTGEKIVNVIDQNNVHVFMGVQNA